VIALQLGIGSSSNSRLVCICPVLSPSTSVVIPSRSTAVSPSSSASLDATSSPTPNGPPQHSCRQPATNTR